MFGSLIFCLISLEFTPFTLPWIRGWDYIGYTHYYVLVSVDYCTINSLFYT